ncbi:MAG: hypothetical protein GYB65_00325 [Chloroflexi bacterium]|nr:hypothetical protein [Chloroflexota bacterium]
MSQQPTEKIEKSTEEVLALFGVSLGGEQFAKIPLDFSRLFYMLYVSLDTQINLAETKANLVLGANAILAAAATLDRSMVQDVLQKSDPGTAEIVSLVLAVCVLFTLIVSVTFALLTSFPRGLGVQTQRNPYFFGDIAQYDEDGYLDMFMGLTGTDIKRAIIRQVHARARIVKRKFLYLRYSMLTLGAGIGLWVLHQLAQALI